MTRLMNQERAGFYPIAPEVTDLILSHILAPAGGRVLDPCAGEGEALYQIAHTLTLQAYGIELHSERSASAMAQIGHLHPGQRRVLHEDYRNVKGSAGGFNLLYLNPPYLFVDDKLDGRAEYQWLRDTRPYLQPDGLLVYVIPQHLLGHRQTAHYLSSWFTELHVVRFPDEHYPRFKQVVVFGRRRPKSAIPDPDMVKRLKQAAEPLLARLPRLDDTTQPRPTYTLPPPIVPDEKMVWYGLFVDPQQALAEAQAMGVQKTAAYEKHLQPRQRFQPLSPLTPMKIGHLTGIIAAGHINNQILERDGTKLLIKGHSYKTKVKRQETEEREKGHAVITHHTEQVISQVTTISPDGTVVEQSGPGLQDFLSQWIDVLTNLVAHTYPPTYTFDLNGFEASLNQLNQGRMIPLVGKPGLLPAQKHATAAAATRLLTHKDAILVGEMGTGKTIMATAVPALLASKGQRMNHIIVLCPPHLVKKWQREIKLVWPVAKTMALKTISDVNRFFATPGPIFGVLKETAARAGSGWCHAVDYCGPRQLNRRTTRQPLSFMGENPLESRELTERQSAYIQYHRGIRCPVCGHQVHKKDTPAAPADFTTSKQTCKQCHHPLWHDARSSQGGKPRYPLATYIKKRFKNQLDLLVADECHQFKGQDSDRGYAFARLCTAARKVVGLSGTIYGGKASTLFYLLYRLSAEMRRAFTNPYDTGKRRLMLKEWVDAYGILTEIETVSYDENGKQTGNTKDKRRIKELPGGSPAMLPWLLNNSVFVSLPDMGFALPTYEEVPVPVALSPEMTARYRQFERTLKDELKERLIRGDKSLLGAYIQSLLTWPDSPWRNKRVEARNGRIVASALALPDPPGHYPKEKAIIQLIQAEKQAGRRVLLLCQQTNTLDITPQWIDMLAAQDIKAAVLNAPPQKREQWVEDQVMSGVDVIITHPRRVETGLDLLPFPTIAWMGSEYSIYTILQANRRSWRIGQTLPVKVYFFVYEGTLQEKALQLIAAKVGAAVRVNGDMVADDSLAELDDLANTDMVTALAKIVAGEAEENQLESLQDAFSKANQAFHSQNSLIGDFDIHQDVPAAIAENGEAAPQPNNILGAYDIEDLEAAIEPEAAVSADIAKNGEAAAQAASLQTILLSPKPGETLANKPPKPTPYLNGTSCQAMKQKGGEWYQCVYQELHRGQCVFGVGPTTEAAWRPHNLKSLIPISNEQRKALRPANFNKARQGIVPLKTAPFAYGGRTWVAVSQTSRQVDEEWTISCSCYEAVPLALWPTVTIEKPKHGRHGQRVSYQGNYYVLVGTAVAFVVSRSAASPSPAPPTPPEPEPETPQPKERLVFGVHNKDGGKLPDYMQDKVAVGEQMSLFR